MSCVGNCQHSTLGIVRIDIFELQLSILEKFQVLPDSSNIRQCYMEPLDEWRHVEKGLVSSKKRAWSLAKPSEAKNHGLKRSTSQIRIQQSDWIGGFLTGEKIRMNLNKI